MGCLIVFRSVTYAQNAQAYLAKKHISTTMVRPPAAVAKGGCSYALRVSRGEVRNAIQYLARSPVQYTGAFCGGGTSGWEEVRM